MTQFVSQDLSSQLWEEFNKIYDYAVFFRDHTTNIHIKYIMEQFIGIPGDHFRRLIGFLTFQEVIVLLHQDKIDEALLLTKKYFRFGRFFWRDGPRDLIESGRLLPSGK